MNDDIYEADVILFKIYYLIISRDNLEERRKLEAIKQLTERHLMELERRRRKYEREHPETPAPHQQK